MLVAGGTTILLCTQYLEEADQLAERIAVIDHGRVIAEGTPGELKASVGTGALHVRLADPGQRSEAAEVLWRALDDPSGPDGTAPTANGSGDPAALSARCADAERAAEAVAELTRSGVRIADFSLARPSLDEVFLALTGHPAESDPDAASDSGEDGGQA